MIDALDALHQEIRTHGGCRFAICEEATHIVPGEGSHTAEVMLVGEAPGASEDEQGRPFVGRSGMLIERGRRLVPWLHPAAALRNPRLRDSLLQDARALPGVLDAARSV